MPNSIILNIPVYQYNTGRGDNCHTIVKWPFKDQQEAERARDNVNIWWTKSEGIGNTITKDEEHAYEQMFDLPGYQTDYAFLTLVTETLIV